MGRGRIVAGAIGIVLIAVACQTDGRASPSAMSSIAVVGTTTTAATLEPTTTPTAVPASTPTPAAPSSATTPDSPSPAPAGPEGFVTPLPADPRTAWAGILWRKLAPTDPLAHVASMTRFPGGYVALGDVAANGDGAHTLVWASPDGRTWGLLDSSVFGPTTVVLGTGATADGLVALTLQTGMNVCEEPSHSLDCWALTGPLQAWTSSDGRTWTVHPGPDVPLAKEISASDNLPALWSGTPGLLVKVPTDDGWRMAVSRDGVDWEILPTAAVPAGIYLDEVAPFKSGFIAIGDSATYTSSDGRAWKRHALSPVVGNNHLVAGRTGVIASGLRYPPTGSGGTWIWWSSLDGDSWRALPRYPPLGSMPGAAAQECRDACPDGNLVGNGERMMAYRGWGKQVGWTSFDGRSWRPLTFVGHPEQSIGWLDDRCTQTLVLLTVGILCTDSNDATWFGEPRT